MTKTISIVNSVILYDCNILFVKALQGIGAPYFSHHSIILLWMCWASMALQFLGAPKKTISVFIAIDVILCNCNIVFVKALQGIGAPYFTHHDIMITWICWASMALQFLEAPKKSQNKNFGTFRIIQNRQRWFMKALLVIGVPKFTYHLKLMTWIWN